MAQPRRALIVIDAQNEYFSGKLRIEYPDPKRSLANIGRAMDAAAAAGLPIVVVQQFAPPGAPIFARDTPMYELHESVARRKRDHLIEKKLPSCFAGTDLADWIAKNGIDTLSVVGYMTHNCVASTVFHALHAGMAVEVLSDATGSLPYKNRSGRTSAEETHRVFSVVFQSRFAAVMDTDAWIAALSGGPVHRDNVFASNQDALSA